MGSLMAITHWDLSFGSQLAEGTSSSTKSPCPGVTQKEQHHLVNHQHSFLHKQASHGELPRRNQPSPTPLSSQAQRSGDYSRALGHSLLRN